MTNARRSSWFASLFLDLLPWTLACAFFLWVYLHLFDRPTAAIGPHIRIVATLWLVLACFRLAVWRWVPQIKIARILLSLICTVPLALLLLHYALTIIGLASWGRVPTWPLLRVYAAQSNELMDALGYPIFPPIAIAILAFTTLWWYQAKFAAGETWGRKVLDRLSGQMTVVGFASLAMLISLQTWRIFSFPALDAEEPLALTFVEAQSRQLQNHMKAGTTGDAAEDAARKAYPPAATRRRSNVILVIGDALRSDHLGLYGYGRAVTPKLDALAKDRGARISPRMRAACAESSCGLLALATSRYVHQLPTNPITLQEVLRRNGYKVHMILGGDHTHFYGLREAYGEVDSYFDGRMQSTRYMNDDQLVLDHVSQLPASDRAQPVLLQFHLMSSHGLGKRQEDANQYSPSGNYYRRLRGLTSVSPELRIEAVNYYDNGLIQLDNVLATLLSELQAKGYLDDALVVLTGDHGEMLGEHGMLSHSNGVHESVLDIPFVLMGFGREVEPFSQHRLASQVDIAPTLLHELGMPIPATWRGHPLQLADARTNVFFQQGARTGLYDLRDPDRLWKYWRDWTAGREFVFDIDADPEESTNLLARTPVENVSKWRGKVAGSLSAAGSGTTGDDPP